MAAAHRRAPAHIKSETGSDASQTLLTRAHAFSFFQAMRLLRHLTGRGASGSDGDAEAMIRIRPNLSLAFPSSDIESIEPLEDETGYRITANFLGLYGTASPLPTFYTEDLLEEAAQDESVSRDFLDIFNQSLYEMLYHGWLKYRQFLNIAEVNDNDYLERLYCLLGLGAEPLRKSNSIPGGDYKLLRYIGLFTQHPRSAAGLGAMLSDALGDIPLEIVPCIPRKASIPPSQRMRMGFSGSRIGVDSFLGEEIADRMGKFRIQIGPLDQAGFLQFTPGNQSYDMLIALTESYMSDPLSYEVELILGARQAQTVALGDPVRSVLGVTTWVFSESHLGEVRTRFSINRA